MPAEHTSTFTLLDNSLEKGSVTIHNGPITAVTIAAFLTQFGALRDAINAITRGTLQKEMWVGDNNVLSNIPPADELAQREMKALVVYQGAVSLKKFSIEIPTFNPVGRMVAGTDIVNLAETTVAAFITAFQAVAKSPDDDTEAVTVLQIRLVGRNN